MGAIWMKAAKRPATELEATSKNLPWMSRWIAMPASIVVLVAGGGLVSVANWDVSQGWTHVGTALLVGSAVLGAALIAPAHPRLLLVAMWAMAAKPF